ncbi:B-box zinc finger protein 22-like [Ziziphus jujuba]|uniref:B-box zinc finger protein 22-like n=1 Tax=Ziziphus jujuba TaxID=326968 RepID=A0A6P3Z233_ZIZJJ|nr:B-box zinc finger protein 22-like [Ziziphus jujuba]
MKIQCNGCQTAEANVLCCADEAALCWACDQKVHAANKLAGKHQRVPLSSSSSSPMPKCDICQETIGYFFCLQDRALLCRKCDVAIHTANPYVSSHQRFLLTGVKVGLEATGPCVSPLMGNFDSIKKPSECAISQSASRKVVVPSTSEIKEAILPVQNDRAGTIITNTTPFNGATSSGSTPAGWHLQEYLGLTNLDQNHGVLDNIPTKFSGRYCM